MLYLFAVGTIRFLVRIRLVLFLSVFLWVHLISEITSTITSSILPIHHIRHNNSTTTTASTSPKQKILKVHIVPHTHDDVGWLKTVEQYYYGRNNTIQRACVSCILDSVMYALQQNPQRTFTYVEIAYFYMWWKEQSREMQAQVRHFVQNGQLSFANGGWCMHDEATTHYMGMIDQMTLGHDFLKRELNYTPMVGWQLDPFGHSRFHAYMSTAMGFNALYLGRIDAQDLQLRQQTQDCEGIWKSSSNLPLSHIFFSLTGSYHGTYGPPIQGFCFDTNCYDEPLVGLNQEQLYHRVALFLDAILEQASRTEGNHILITMGEDFQYENAMVNFKNVDLLIETLNQLLTHFYTSHEDEEDKDHDREDGKRDQSSKTSHEKHPPHSFYASSYPVSLKNWDHIQVFYSNPEIYTKAKYEEWIQNNRSHSFIKTRIKKDDFFPYSDCDHCYWTGYFTSRPTLKRMERIASSFLHAARQIEVLFLQNHSTWDRQYNTNPSVYNHTSPLWDLETAVGIIQHHDGVSGTSKQHVADDYANKIYAGMQIASAFVSHVVTHFMDASVCQLNTTNRYDSTIIHLGEYPIMAPFTFCEGSICQLSNSILELNEGVYIAVYNSLSFTRDEISTLRILQNDNSSYIVEKYLDSSKSWDVVKSASIPSEQIINATKRMTTLLYFSTSALPPLGFSVFRVTRQDSFLPINNQAVLQNEIAQSYVRTQRRRLPAGNEHTDIIRVKNIFFTVTIDRGMIAFVTFHDADSDIEVKQSWGFYKSYGSQEKGQNSGAYIFRPSIPNEELNMLIPDPDKIDIIRTDLFTEIRTKFTESWIEQVIRIYPNQAFIDVSYTVGPIPVESDGVGKEIVTRFNTNIKNNGIFFTDSNGREFIERRRSHRPTWKLKEFEPIAGNYYPVNTAIFIKDEDRSFAVLTDRAQGGASLTDGSVEVMVHRRTLFDDSRGVGEAMNETTEGMRPYPPYGDGSRVGEGIVVEGTHRIVVGKGRPEGFIARSQLDSMFAAPMLFSSSGTAVTQRTFCKQLPSILKEDLPRNLQIITLKVKSDSVLLRVSHQYDYEESEQMSKPVVIDLSTVFKHFEIISFVELTLSANQKQVAWEKERFDWISDDKKLGNRWFSDDSFIVHLHPMEIKTFELRVKWIVVDE